MHTSGPNSPATGGERRICSAHLVVRRGRRTASCYLNVQVEVTGPEPITPADWIGGDMGRTDVLHTSTGQSWAGAHRKAVRERYQRVRRSLQKNASKGTRLTRRRGRAVLPRLSGRERRFHVAENHAISRSVVQDALVRRAGICTEDHAGLRLRTTVACALRWEHAGWISHQLRGFRRAPESPLVHEGEVLHASSLTLGVALCGESEGHGAEYRSHFITHISLERPLSVRRRRLAADIW